MPIVQSVVTLYPVKEAHGSKGFHKAALFALPLCSQFDILIGHPRQITIAAIRCRPKNQANQVPAGRLPQATHQFLGLRMTGQASRDSCISGHSNFLVVD